MPKALFVAGLPGSGKSGYLDTLANEGFQRFDDFKANAIGDSSTFRHSSRFHSLVRALRDGHNCVIADIDFCRSEARAEAANIIRDGVPRVGVEWHYFENAAEQCRLNIRARGRDSMDQAKEQYNHAAVWRMWDAIAQTTYVRGVVDGAINVYVAAGEEWLGPGQLFKTPEAARIARVRQRVFVGNVESRIPAAMSDLYRDPANSYVALVDMVYIARDRLEGKDVEKSLADARKRAVELDRITGGANR